MSKFNWRSKFHWRLMSDEDFAEWYRQLKLKALDASIREETIQQDRVVHEQRAANAITAQYAELRQGKFERLKSSLPHPNWPALLVLTVLIFVWWEISKLFR